MNELARIASRCAAALRRARLYVAEQDLVWIEAHSEQAITQQRELVGKLRRRVAVDSALISARDIERKAERAIKRRLLA